MYALYMHDIDNNQHGGKWNVTLSLILNEVNTNAKRSLRMLNCQYERISVFALIVHNDK